MTLAPETPQRLPASQPATISIVQVLLLILMLGWLILAPILVGILTAMLPETWPASSQQLLAVLILAGLLLVPFGGLTIMVYWQRQDSLRPLALALLATALYITASGLIRGLPGAGSGVETTLRLLGLTFLAALIGG